MAVKLTPYYTAFGHLAAALGQAGASGLVLFNRFYQSNVDTRTMTLVPQAELSTSAELALRLHWLALLHGRVRPSLAASGGVATPDDGIKALLAGADVVQLVSALLRHGPGHVATMRQGLERWLEWQHIDTMRAMIGRASFQTHPDPAAFERGHYIRTLAELDTMTAFLAAVENSGLSTWLRESNSIWAYPTVLTLHTIGLALLVGANAALDLRVLGVGKAIAVAELRPLMRWMWIGFWVNALSGVVLLAADATTKAASPMFLIKTGLVVAGVIVLRALDRQVFGAAAVPGVLTPAARSLAVASLAIWFVAIAAGRLMAYPGLFFGI